MKAEPLQKIPNDLLGIDGLDEDPDLIAASKLLTE